MTNLIEAKLPEHHKVAFHACQCDRHPVAYDYHSTRIRNFRTLVLKNAPIKIVMYKTKLQSAKWDASLGYAEVLIDLVFQLVTHLFGISQQHLCVVLVEHWIVSASVPSPHCSFHHNHCLAFPHLHQEPSLL